MCHRVTVARLTLAAAIHVAVVLTFFLKSIGSGCSGKIILNRGQLILITLCIIDGFSSSVPRTHVVLAGKADAASGNEDGIDTRFRLVLELVRPAEGEALGFVFVLGRFFCDGAHRGHLAGAIDALLHPTALDFDLSVAVDTACTLHGRNHIRIILRLDIQWCKHCGIDAAVAAAKHIAPDGAVFDFDESPTRYPIRSNVLSIARQGAHLAAAIDVAFDDGICAADGDVGVFHLAQVGP